MLENSFSTIDKFLSESYSSSLHSGHNFFNILMSKIEEYHDKPCHSILELRESNTKLKGTLFECFCVRYLQQVKGLLAWLLEDTPEEILLLLNLKRRDIGIDIIAYNPTKNLYYAVLAKYRNYKKTYKGKKAITWKELSTFFSLADRTGPWAKYIVMTNSDYILHLGYKREKDLSICYGTFSRMSKEHLMLLVGIKGSILSEQSDALKPTLELLRELRLKKLQQ